MYRINYHTGAGDETTDGDLEEAMRIADEGIRYTQQSVTIEDERGHEVARRNWCGTTDGIEEEDDFISYGDFGYYGGWIVS